MQGQCTWNVVGTGRHLTACRAGSCSCRPGMQALLRTWPCHSWGNLLSARRPPRSGPWMCAAPIPQSACSPSSWQRWSSHLSALATRCWAGRPALCAMSGLAGLHCAPGTALPCAVKQADALVARTAGSRGVHAQRTSSRSALDAYDALGRGTVLGMPVKVPKSFTPPWPACSPASTASQMSRKRFRNSRATPGWPASRAAEPARASHLVGHCVTAMAAPLQCCHRNDCGLALVVVGLGCSRACDAAVQPAPALWKALSEGSRSRWRSRATACCIASAARPASEQALCSTVSRSAAHTPCRPCRPVDGCMSAGRGLMPSLVASEGATSACPGWRYGCVIVARARCRAQGAP